MEKKFESRETKWYTQIRWNGIVIKIPKINIDDDLRYLFFSYWAILYFE